MQFKISVAVLLAFTLLLLVPAVRADAIRAPTQASFETAAASIPVLDEDSRTTPRPARHDDDWQTVPEPCATLTLVLLAAGVWMFRKRMVAAR